MEREVEDIEDVSSLGEEKRFLIVYFQCIRKYSDYTFDYGDMAV